MKIAILTDVIDRSKRTTGVPSYGKYLIEAMLDLEDKPEIYLLHYGKNDCFIYKKTKEIIIKLPKIPLPRPILVMYITLFKLPKIFKRQGIGVIHIIAPTFFEAPIFFLSHVKKIITFHDIRQFAKKRKFKWSFSYFKRVLHEALKKILFRFLVKRADRIIAVSSNTKKDLINFLKVPEGKITIVLSATDIKINKQDYPLPKSHFIDSSYIIGSEPNLELLNIFFALRNKGIKHKLLIYGHFGKELLYKLKNFIEQNNLKEQVVFTGHIEGKELLTKVYSNADLLIHHVDYEGFGLPPLEAMSCGCPVITAHVASLPEVVGDAGILLKPFNLKEWIDAAFAILNSSEKQKEMIEKGFERANQFSWQKTAKNTYGVYKGI